MFVNTDKNYWSYLTAPRIFTQQKAQSVQSMSKSRNRSWGLKLDILKDTFLSLDFCVCSSVKLPSISIWYAHCCHQCFRLQRKAFKGKTSSWKRRESCYCCSWVEIWAMSYTVCTKLIHLQILRCTPSHQCNVLFWDLVSRNGCTKNMKLYVFIQHSVQCSAWGPKP